MPKDLELLILAAGRSERMGSPKGLLDVGGVTLLERTIVSACEFSIPIRIVIARGDCSYDSILSKYSRQVTVFENDNVDVGPFYSLQVGSKGARSLLVTHVDRPLPPMGELQKLIDDSDLTLPYSQAGRGGHPILLNSNVLNAIGAIIDCSVERLDRFLEDKKWTKKRVIVSHPFFFYNLNTDGDYQRFLNDISKEE